jgi:hypothetical protein
VWIGKRPTRISKAGLLSGRKEEYKICRRVSLLKDYFQIFVRCDFQKPYHQSQSDSLILQRPSLTMTRPGSPITVIKCWDRFESLSAYHQAVVRQIINSFLSWLTRAHMVSALVSSVLDVVDVLSSVLGSTRAPAPAYGRRALIPPPPPPLIASCSGSGTGVRMPSLGTYPTSSAQTDIEKRVTHRARRALLLLLDGRLARNLPLKLPVPLPVCTRTLTKSCWPVAL